MFGGIPLKGEDGTRKSGAIFDLNQAPSSDHSLSVSSDWVVEVRKGLHYAIAHSPLNLALDQALEGGINAVQQALDLLCVAEHQRLQAQNFEREHIVWFEEAERNILRATTVSGLSMSVSASVKVTHADGTAEEPDLTPIPAWHECFRYYRLAQVTDDPFDAFRNLWLSLELALSLKSAKNPGEREVDWIKRVGQMLEGSLPKTAWPSNGANPIQDLVDDHYIDTRCRLFHAKDNKSRLNPHVTTDRRIVVARFGTLQPFVREVLAEVAGAPRGGGVVTYQGFQRLMQTAYGDGLILLSASLDSLEPDETVASACWKNAEVVDGSRMVDKCRPGLELWGSRVDTNGLTPLKICRIGLASKGRDGTAKVLYTSSARSAMLELEQDFDEFEPVCGVELVNQSSPRARFLL